MYCPNCGTQNELKQKYCRQCGQALSGVWLALEGNTSQSLEKLNASEKLTSGASATLIIFTLIGLVMAIIGFAIHDPIARNIFSNIAIINLLLGLAISLPLIFHGKANLKRAIGLLSKSPPEPGNSLPGQNQQPNNLLTKDLNVELYQLPHQGSVTEDTTRNLPTPERLPRKLS